MPTNMENKITSVEWMALQLYEKMEMKGSGSLFQDILEQAKAMHQQEVETSHIMGQGLHAKSLTNLMIRDNAESYYNETYKKDMTSVEWLIDNLKVVLPKDLFNGVVIQDLFKQAKEMDNVTNESVCPKCQSYDWRYNISTDYMECGNCGFVK